MDINFSKEDIAFRDEVRDWLANDYPKHVKEKTDAGITISKDDLIDFHQALSKKGWMVYNWPVEYGGTGWSASKLYIFNKELGLAGCPPILPFGVGMVGASAGFSMEASYGIRIGNLEVRGGIRSTETLMAKTSESVELGRAGWMDGQIVLVINL